MTNKETIQNKINEPMTTEIKIKKNNRRFVFWILTLFNILINMDHGTIPAASNEIKSDLRINDAELGSFGSFVYLGNLIGALVLSRLIDIVNRKKLTFLFSIICCILLFTFISSSVLWYLYLNRVLVGFVQSFFAIYFPVWIDQFGSSKRKTFMMSVFNITSPLGVMFGYIITVVIKINLNWRLSYVIQIILILVISLISLKSDDQLFSNRIFSINSVKVNKNCGQDKKEEKEKEKEEKEQKEEVETEIEKEGKKKEKDEQTVFVEINSLISITKIKKFCDIIKNPIYVFCCLSITNLLFISTAIIFWASDYSINVLGGDPKQVLVVFVVICLTGPILGILLGGFIVDKCANGYEGKHSILFCIIFSIGAFLCGFPVKWISNVYLFGVCLWGLLLFGGGVIPNIQGIMISSLNPENRAAGNSISNILQNLIGFLPAPFVYGMIFERTKKTDPKLAMGITLWYSSIGIVFIVVSALFRYRKYREKVLIKSNIEIPNVKMNENHENQELTVNSNAELLANQSDIQIQDSFEK